jgi:hypothetical protein
MYLGGSEFREGTQAVVEAAVVEALGSHTFDGIVGQDVLGQYPVRLALLCFVLFCCMGYICWLVGGGGGGGRER